MSRLTTLEKLVLKYPDKAWDWGQLSSNACITLQFIKDHPEFQWDYEGLVWNSNITEEFIIQNMNCIDLSDLWFASPPNVSLEFLYNLFVESNEKNISYWMSQNELLTLSFVDSHPKIKWDWEQLSLWILLDDFDPEREWHWDKMSNNQNVTEEFIEQFINKPWDWIQLSSHSNITMEFVERYPDKPWYWYLLSQNPNLTIPFILKHPEKRWDWFGISMNSGITQQDVTKHPELPWKTKALAQNESIIPNNSIKIHYMNPNVTPEMIGDDANWYHLSLNTFERDTNRYESVRARKCVKCVQKWWRRWRQQHVYKEVDDVIGISDLAHFVVRPNPRRG